MNKDLSAANSSLDKPIDYIFFILGGGIPLILALYWPIYQLHPFATSSATRPAVFAIAAALGLLLAGMRVSRIEMKLAGALGVAAVTYLGTALTAVDVNRSMQGLVKHLVCFIVAILLSRALRRNSAANGFGYSLLIGSFLVSLFILVIYVRVDGLRFPTYAAARELKGIAMAHGLSLNTISATAVLMYLQAMCLLRTRKIFLLAGVALVGIGTFFTGSRAQLGALLLTGFVLVVVNGLRSPKIGRRFAAWVLLAASFVGIAFVYEQASFKTMSDATEGRWDLWYVAVQKFTERPLVGFGYESAPDDLLSRTPGVYQGIFKTEGKSFGGYHNLYLTVLAEEGLVGLIGFLALNWFMLRSCSQLAFRHWRTWQNGQWALVAGLFLLIGGTVEVSGLLAYGSAPTDYLAYIFLAIVVSRFSQEEDCARLMIASQQMRSSVPARPHKIRANGFPWTPLHEPQA